MSICKVESRDRVGGVRIWSSACAAVLDVCLRLVVPPLARFKLTGQLVFRQPEILECTKISQLRGDRTYVEGKHKLAPRKQRLPMNPGDVGGTHLPCRNRSNKDKSLIAPRMPTFSLLFFLCGVYPQERGALNELQERYLGSNQLRGEWCHSATA